MHGGGKQQLSGFAAQTNPRGLSGDDGESAGDGDCDYLLLERSRSAAITFTVRQQVSLACIVTAAMVAFCFEPGITYGLLMLALCLFYLALVLFRLKILADLDLLPAGHCILNPPVKPYTGDGTGTDGRRYLILVPLYREANQVRELVESLSELRWKCEKQICLLCEHEDTTTITAVEAQLPRPGFELLIVPPGKLRTKPRALNFALRQHTADFVVIYDAEDRPHPDQLMEAGSVFANAEDKLACLQAPLVIDNASSGFLPRMFAIEYVTLFKGILPALCRWGAPVPLGGTSNHFRHAALIKAGAWDSYNVTEDADLGMRLARHDFQCGMLVSPTFEEAPIGFPSWLKQRTRWTKGWLQTLLVHFRQPVTLYRDLGFRNFVLFQLILTALVVSQLIHPIFIAMIGYHIAQYWGGVQLDGFQAVLAGTSAFNLIAGYLGYCFLAFAVAWRMQPREYTRGELLGWVAMLPLYWLLISLAGWRALAQLLTNPTYWEKTEHHGIGRARTGEHR